jgi:hypothetical protein
MTMTILQQQFDHTLERRQPSKRVIRTRLKRQQHDKEPKLCRICAGDRGLMVSPCLCRGSHKYVHLECLNKWRLSDSGDTSSARFKFCPNCKFVYTIDCPFPSEKKRFLQSNMYMYIMMIFLVLFMMCLSEERILKKAVEAVLALVLSVFSFIKIKSLVKDELLDTE